MDTDGCHEDKGEIPILLNPVESAYMGGSIFLESTLSFV